MVPTPSVPHFKGFGRINLKYKIRNCQKIMIKTQWHKRVITRIVESDFTILPSVWIWRAWFWIFQNVAFCTTDSLLWYRSWIKTNCFIIFVWVSDQAKVSPTVHFANTSENPLNDMIKKMIEFWCFYPSYKTIFFESSTLFTKFFRLG